MKSMEKCANTLPFRRPGSSQCDEKATFAEESKSVLRLRSVVSMVQHEGGDMHDGVILLHLYCKNDAAIALRNGLDGLRGVEFSALELDV